MDYFGFFGWKTIAQIFTLFIEQIVDNVRLAQGQTMPEVTPGLIADEFVKDTIISLGVGGGIFLLFLILGGLGLNALAKKEGLKKSALAYIPFFNTYFAGKVAGETSFFGMRMKRAGLYAAICEFVFSALQTASLTLQFFFTKGMYIVYEEAQGVVTWQLDPTHMAADDRIKYIAASVCEYLSTAAFIVACIFLMVAFVALYKKYFARGPVLMAVLSTVLPFRGAALFAVRKNERVNYEEFMRKRREIYAQRYPQNPPQNQQSPQNPQNRPPQGDGGDPFEEYKNHPQDDPFSEFGGESKKGDGGNAGGPPKGDDPFGDV